MWNCGSPYRERDATLARLGYESYQSYLGSQLWASIKAKAIRKSKGRCSRCRSMKGIQVHHRAYDEKTLIGDDLRSLSVVCGRCHLIAESPQQARHGMDRLSEASHYIMTSRPRQLERCWSWYLRHKRYLNKLQEPEEARAMVEMFRQRATSGEGRCVYCGAKRLNPTLEPKAMKTGYVFCGQHPWGQVRLVAAALKLDLTQD